MNERRILPLVLGATMCMVSHLSTASTVRGNIQEISSSFIGLDNFVVVLEPGWIPHSCSGSVGGIPTSQPLPILFMRGDSHNDEVFDRSFGAALTLMLRGKKGNFTASTGPCGSPAYSILSSSDN